MRYLAALAVFASGVAVGQPSDSNVPPVAGGVPLGVTIVEQDVVATGYRASKLIGAPVHNDDRATIGRIGDLIVAPDGKLSFAIIDVGGFLGIGEHHVAIPVNQFHGLPNHIVLPGATRAALKQLPQFVYARNKS